MDAAFEKALQKIPPQLRERPGTRFTVILSGQKKPEGKDWAGVNGANYSIYDPVLAGYLSQGHNYGVLCGHADLVVPDLDDPARLEELGVMQRIPNTFQDKTGRGGRHAWFDCPEIDHQIGIYDPVLIGEDGEPLHLGEIQSRGQQVVGPGSTHPNGNRYEIINDAPIMKISKTDLLKIFDGLVLTGIDDPKEEPRRSDAMRRQSGGHSLGNNISIDQLCWPKDIKERKGSEVTGSHSLHGSDTGKNFSVNTAKNCWHCFRHNTGGGPLEWIAVEAGLIRCEDVKPGCLDNKETFKKVLDIAREKGFDIPESKPRSKSKPAPTGCDGDKAFDQMCAMVPKWIDEYHFKTMADDETIYRYLGGVYVDDGANFIKQLVELELGNKCNNHLKNEAVGKVQRQTYVKRDDFNKTWVLNLKNGLLNLETGEFTAHTPDLLSNIQLPVEYDPSAVCPAIDKFRVEVLEPEDMDLVEEILGWLLWPSYSVHKAVMMVGSGRNGKGTLLRLMVAMLGKANVSDVSLQQLCDNRFMPARLYGKMANLGGDLPAIDISDTAAFKGLTGGDRMTVENKFGQPFEFDNRAKLIFSTNRIPKTPDDSYAFYSRWILIVYSHIFEVQKGTGDEGLDKKLQTPEELSGMLNVALRGLKRLQSNNWKISYSKTVEDVELLYKRLSEPVVAFLLDECLAEFDESVEKTVFYNAFKKYSEKHGLKPMSQSKFWRALKDQSEIPVSDYRPEGNQPRCVRGVRLKPLIPITGQNSIQEIHDFSYSLVQDDMNKIEKDKEEKKEEGEVGKNVDFLDAKKDATLEVPAPEKSYLEHPKKPTPDDRVRCRILKKDGYRTQIPSPEDQLKFVDHLFPAGEIIEVQSYKLRDLIERGTVELVA